VAPGPAIGRPRSRASEPGSAGGTRSTILASSAEASQRSPTLSTIGSGLACWPRCTSRRGPLTAFAARLSANGVMA
jgi:hypothetical protein